MTTKYEVPEVTVISETQSEKDVLTHEYEIAIKPNNRGLDPAVLLVVRDLPGVFKVGSVYNLTLTLEENE